MRIAELLSEDCFDLIVAMNKHDVSYLMVGGYAINYYGFIRHTGDTDLFYNIKHKNCKKLYQSLIEFWGSSPPHIDNYTDLMVHGQVLQFGIQPNRIDLVNDIDGVDFEECWRNRNQEVLEVENKKITLPIISLNDLIKNKKSTDRKKDQIDVDYLENMRNQRL